MNVTGRGSRAWRVLVALGLVVGGMVFVDGGGAVRAAIPPGFTLQPPERLYMLPANPLAPIPAAIVALAVPVQHMTFTSTPLGDLISGDNREIEVTFTDTENLPGSPPPCNIVDVPGAVGGNSDYPIGNCTRIQMSVAHGKLKVGTLTKAYQVDAAGNPSSLPVNAVYLTASGARVDMSDTASFDAGQDYTNNDGVSILNLNGTKQQINDALKLLQYTPDPDEDDDGDPAEHDFYHYDGGNAETLHIALIPEDTNANISNWDVDIRVLDVNDWPELDGANELGDGSGDGPANQTANPGIEKKIPGTYSVSDVDNDDLTDSYGPDGKLGGGDDITDPDGNDGAGDDMMLIGYLSCGKPILPGDGFHFDSASWSSVTGTIQGALDFALGISSGPPVMPPATQAEVDQYNNLLLARNAFMTGLAATPLADTTLQSSGNFTYGNFFVGIGEIDDVRDGLANIFFQHNQENDTCNMLVITSDLGNNGLPIQYLSDPEARQYGVQIPFFGFDWDQFTITTGAFQKIDASFVPADPLFVGEGDTATATIAVTPASHPAFELHFSTLDGVAPNPAIGNSDFAKLTDLTVSVPQDAPTVTVDTNALNDLTPEGSEQFTFQITTPTAPPPGSFTVPVGYKIESATPTRQVVILDDDDAPNVIGSVSSPTVLEGDAGNTNLAFVVGLAGGAMADGNESFAASTSSSSPSDAGTDYDAITNQTVTFAPGASTATVNVVVHGDVVIEGDEQVTLTLSDPSNVSIDPAVAPAVGTIQNDDFPPTVSIADVANVEGNAGTSTMVFTAQLSHSSTDPVTVDAATSNGTASTADSDYVGASQMLTFPPGITSQAFSVVVNGDTKFELDETFGVNLTNPSGATLGDGTAVGTITNDDVAPTLSIDDMSVPEGNVGTSTITFTVQLSNASSVPATVVATTADGTAIVGDNDYVANTQTLTIAPGLTSQTFTVTVNGDTKFEPNEAFAVNLSSPSGATILDGAGAGTILNDDTAPTISIGDVMQPEGNSGTSPFVFTLQLSNPSAQTVSVSAATSDGTATTANSDYVPVTQTVTFAPGVTSQTFTVLGNGDLVVEPDQTFNVTLSAATNGSIGDGSGVGTIVNDDVAPGTPGVSIDDVTIAEGNAGTTSFTFTLALTEAPTSLATVMVTTADGAATTVDSDYVASTGMVTFPAGQPGPQTFTVLVTGDTKYELDETFTAGLSAPTGGLVITDNTGVGTITNDDAPPTISITDVTVPEGNSGTTAFTFTVALSAASALPATVTATTADGTATTAGLDYAAGTQLITFAPGETTKTFTTMVNGDIVPESDEAFTVALTNATGATIGDASGLGTITNDDQVPNQQNALTIQVPANIVKDADPNQNGAIVTYPAPTTSGGTAPVVVNCDHASGAFYPVGVTTVTCTATDAAPDESPWHLALADPAVFVFAAMTASGTFTITVNQAATTTTTVPGGGTPSTTIPGSIIPGGTLPPELFPPSGGPGVTPTGFPGAGLPETGSNVSELLGLGASLLLLGGLLMLVRRRPDRTGRPASR